MNLEQQVCSLDLAKRLKELGVKQEGQFFWQGYLHSGHTIELVQFGKVDGNYDYCAAFTVAELGEMLPPEINWGQGFKSLQILLLSDQPRKWDVRYYLGGSGIAPRGQSAETEADARAKMLIYLLENKLIVV